MPTMRAMQVPEAGAAFELVEREIPTPGRGEVRIRVDACGICHSDQFVKDGLFPGIAYPRVPGHEVAGGVDAVGEGVTRFAEGDRVGLGWHGGHCYTCDACLEGDFVCCDEQQIAGISYDGGYADYVVAPAGAVVRMPDGIDAHDAAPLLCAGITTYNALRNTEAQAGDLVAVQGIGGLGHLAVQYAKHLGFEVAALSRGTDKEDLARDLGADHFIDAKADDPAEALQKLGGARVVVATAPSAKAIESVINGLGRNGTLLLVAAAGEPVSVPAFALIGQRRAIQGWPSGDADDSEDTLTFSVLRDIRPMIETFPLEQANEAYERMITNQARFRVVLDLTDGR